MLGFSTPDVASTPARRTLGHALVKRLRLSSVLPIALILAAGLSSNAAFAAPLPAPTAPEADGDAAIVPAVFSQRAEGLSPKVLAMALDAVADARARGVSGRSDRLTVIDYTLPSTTPRLWVLDLAKGKVLFHELVAHGAGSGDKFATHFSNVNESRATSLGLFLTGDTYEGGNGYSLKLKGLDSGINDLAEMRKIVMHGAWYVSDDHSRQFGMIGRSWGCPAIPLQDAQPVIDAIKGGSFVYSYAASAAPTVQHAAYRAATAKAPRAVAASYTTSSRSRHAARQRTRGRGRVVVASYHGRSASRTASRAVSHSATRSARSAR
jgi:hypothetical protein